MKYVLMTALALFVPTAFAMAQDVTKEDVVKLSKAGLSDQVIIEFMKSRNTRIALTANDVVDLKAAGVGNGVITFMLESPPQEKVDGNRGCGAAEARSTSVTVQPTVVTPPAYSGSPYYYYGDGPYYYGYGYPYRYRYYYPYTYSHVYSRPWHYGYTHYGYTGYGHGSYGWGHGYSGGAHGGGHSGGGHR